MRRADSLEKTLMLGKVEGRRRRGWQKMRWLGGITNVMDISLSFAIRSWQSINSKGNQPWLFIGKTDAEAEVTIIGPPIVKSQLTGKDPDAGKDWGQEEKRATEDEMVGWCHWLNGHEFEQTMGDSEGQGSLECCSSWGHRVRHNLATEQQVRGPPEFQALC